MSENRLSIASRVGKIIMNAVPKSSIDIHNHFLVNDDEVKYFVKQARDFGLSIALTQGTFDLIHIGHARYVREARKHGSLLIVGLDDDVKARGRKGPNRPVVPFDERMEMLCHLRYVDAVTVKKHDHPKWHLIRLVKPEVLIAVEGTYTEDDISELKKICGDVVVLERQAETSTSAKVRTLVHDGAENLTKILKERIPAFVDGVYDELRSKT